jgi:hypothetical protein
VGRPLQADGRVFTQWVEILPTDQIVAIDYKPEDHL